MSSPIKLVGYGVDTLILNVRYSDTFFQPVKQELDETLQRELDYLQASARQDENAVATDWSFNDAVLFVEPHGAGKQWRWLLTCRWLTLVVSRGKFNDVIAQVRFSSEFLWSCKYTDDALYKVHTFLMSLFGELIHLQVSEVHLCTDVMGYDFAQVDYENAFVTRVRKNQAIYSSTGVDGVSLDNHVVSTLAFSNACLADFLHRFITRHERLNRSRIRRGFMTCGVQGLMLLAVASGTVKVMCGVLNFVLSVISCIVCLFQ